MLCHCYDLIHTPLVSSFAAQRACFGLKCACGNEARLKENIHHPANNRIFIQERET
jgi:hypothetical protein